MPQLSTPRSLPFLILVPFTRVEPSNATGTLSPAVTIAGAGDDLDGRLAAGVYLADYQLIGVGMLFNGKHLAYHYFI